MVLGGAPLWELAVAIVLMLAASYGLVRLGARAYGGAVLRFGPKLSIRELWRSSSGSRKMEPRVVRVGRTSFLCHTEGSGAGGG